MGYINSEKVGISIIRLYDSATVRKHMSWQLFAQKLGQLIKLFGKAMIHSGDEKLYDISSLRAIKK